MVYVLAFALLFAVLYRPDRNEPRIKDSHAAEARVAELRTEQPLVRKYRTNEPRTLTRRGKQPWDKRADQYLRHFRGADLDGVFGLAKEH